MYWTFFWLWQLFLRKKLFVYSWYDGVHGMISPFMDERTELILTKNSLPRALAPLQVFLSPESSKGEAKNGTIKFVCNWESGLHPHSIIRWAVVSYHIIPPSHITATTRNTYYRKFCFIFILIFQFFFIRKLRQNLFSKISKRKKRPFKRCLALWKSNSTKLSSS